MITLLVFLLASVIAHGQTVQPQSPLTLTQVERLVKLPAPDAVIAGEIRARGISFTVGPDTLEGFRRMGAGELTIKALKERIPTGGMQELSIHQLTTVGNVKWAAVSPDGKYLAYVRGISDKEALWVKHLATNTDIEVTSLPGKSYQSVTFSPDSNYIYYMQTEDAGLNKIVRALYRIPIVGGTPKGILKEMEGDLSFNRDGTLLTFFRWFPTRNKVSLMTAKVDGQDQTEVATFDVAAIPESPIWSPDGKVIAYRLTDYGSGKPSARMVAVRLDDHDHKIINLTARTWLSITGAEWLANGSGIVLTAFDESLPRGQVWFLSYPGGIVRQITHDLSDYDGVSLTRDGKTLVTRRKESNTTVWVVPSDLSNAKQITSGFGRYSFLNWTPDGRIVYRAPAIFYSVIWIMNADGTKQYQLTEDTHFSSDPSVSPDSRYIIFSSTKDGPLRIWRMDIDGNNQRPLTKGTRGGEEIDPVCSPDGRWVIYRTLGPRHKLWRVSIDGGDSVELINRQVNSIKLGNPVFSPDGRFLAYVYAEAQEDGSFQWKIAITRFDGGSELSTEQKLDLPRGVHYDLLAWAPDGKAFDFLLEKDELSNIVRYPIDGGATKYITNFDSQILFSHAWSRDGKHLAYSRGLRINDAVVIKNIKW